MILERIDRAPYNRIYNMPFFEWNEQKAAANKRKHGIGFEDAASALTGLALTRQSPQSDEARFVSLCMCNGRLIAVVWTKRDDAIRLISARIARANERKNYNQAVGGSAGKR